MGAPVFPSSHSLPPTFVVPPKSGWVSLTLGEFVREPHLAVDLSHVLKQILTIKFIFVFPSV